MMKARMRLRRASVPWTTQQLSSRYTWCWASWTGMVDWSARATHAAKRDQTRGAVLNPKSIALNKRKWPASSWRSGVTQCPSSSGWTARCGKASATSTRIISRLHRLRSCSTVGSACRRTKFFIVAIASTLLGRMSFSLNFAFELPPLLRRSMMSLLFRVPSGRSLTISASLLIVPFGNSSMTSPADMRVTIPLPTRRSISISASTLFSSTAE